MTALDAELLRELARVKVKFQLRALTTVLGFRPVASSVPARVDARAFHDNGGN